jgi:hypothetical protein
MSYGAFLALVGQRPDPDINLARMVWVVTVHAPIVTPSHPLASSQTKQVYTVVMDAFSRQQIELIAGRGL